MNVTKLKMWAVKDKTSNEIVPLFFDTREEARMLRDINEKVVKVELTLKEVA